MVTFTMPRLAYDMRLMNCSSQHSGTLSGEGLGCQTKTIKSHKMQFLTRLRGSIFSANFSVVTCSETRRNFWIYNTLNDDAKRPFLSETLYRIAGPYADLVSRSALVVPQRFQTGISSEIIGSLLAERAS